jgi:aryl-alcohol dehydrogenase-like predicted oxidoreductase
MKIALGTAQFGLSYGAFNRGGQVSAIEVRKILSLAVAKGVSVLDTAHAYGESEEVLGRLGAGARYSIVTKIPALDGVDAAASASSLFAQSLERLRVNHVYGLLLHRAADLLDAGGDILWKALVALREQNKVQKIGFSAYGPDEALQVMQRFSVDLIQIPMNVFDTRHHDAGVLALCKSRGIEVHARSVFLQGFALALPEGLSGHLAQYSTALAGFRGRCAELGITPLKGALHYALNRHEIARVVVGTDSVAQFDDILRAAQDESIASEAFADVHCDDLDLIDPSRWH